MVYDDAISKTFPEEVRYAISLLFDRMTGRYPRVEAAGERGHLRVALLMEFQRQTGAGVLVRSGAVGDDQLIRIQRCAERVCA